MGFLDKMAGIFGEPKDEYEEDYVEEGGAEELEAPASVVPTDTAKRGNKVLNINIQFNNITIMVYILIDYCLKLLNQILRIASYMMATAN